MTQVRADQSLLEHSAEFSLIVHHHLGLGDHFICNGLVHSILAKFGCSTLFLLTKPEYAVTVRKLYEDFPAVEIVELPEAYRLKEGVFSLLLSQSNSMPLLKVSFKQDGKSPFDFAFYRQLGIPFFNRWTQFRAPRQNSQSELFFRKLIAAERYCLIANQSSAGEIEIDVQTSLPVYRLKLGMTENMLDWIMVITNAAEIHCVDSAALHLVDSLNLKNTRLVYHNTGKGLFFCANEWITVNAFGARVAPIVRVAPVK
jgi:hypothetical protein